MTLLFAAPAWDRAAWMARLATHIPGMPIVALGDAYDPAAILYVASWKHPAGALDGLPNLRAILSLGAGVDHLLADPALPDVPLVRVIDPDLTHHMSEYVVMHCLMHLRQTRRYEAQQRARVWDDDRGQPAARQVRVGVMGLGTLGRDAAAKLAALGFDVAGWSRRPQPGAPVPAYAGAEGLEAFLARTDILVCLLPLTPDTRGLLDHALFRRLARDGRLGGPVLINAARGGLQVEADILAALEDGTLQAATLDVFETEPLPADSPLWTHPRVTVTPHNAAMSEPEAVAAFLARQIARIEAGETPEGLVSRADGY